MSLPSGCCLVSMSTPLYPCVPFRRSFYLLSPFASLHRFDICLMDTSFDSLFPFHASDLTSWMQLRMMRSGVHGGMHELKATEPPIKLHLFCLVLYARSSSGESKRADVAQCLIADSRFVLSLMTLDSAARGT